MKLEDARALEEQLINSAPAVSPPMKAKRVELESLDGELAAELRLVRTSTSISPPMRVKKLDNLEGLNAELAEAIVEAKGPPPRDDLFVQDAAAVPPVPAREDDDHDSMDKVVESRQKSPMQASVLPPSPSRPLPQLPVSSSPPAVRTINVAALPPPPILPSEVRATSPRSSMVLASSELPVALSPRPSECESPRVPIPPLARKSTGDVRASTSPRAKKVVSPRTLGRSFKAPDVARLSESPPSSPPPSSPPPPPPPPPAAAASPRSASATLPAGAQPPNMSSVSPRLRSSTLLEEDLVAQAQRLKASPPSSPRPASPGNDVYDLLYRKAQELRKSVARGGDDKDEDDDADW